MASRKDTLYASLSRGRQVLVDRVEQVGEQVSERLDQHLRPEHVPPTHAPVDGASNRSDGPPAYTAANYGPALPPGTTTSSSAQQAVDEARAAARRPMTEVQDQHGTGKTVHAYFGAGGCAKVELFTPLQVVPTYMGGTKERGRGAVQGRVLYSPRQGDRVSHISIKIKCVALVRVPVMNPNAPYATSVLHRSPELERYSEKEVLLLQLEQILYRAPVAGKEAPLEVRQQIFHPPRAVGNLPQAEVLDGGATAAFSFNVDLPSESSRGDRLPPSFVLPADEDAKAPSPADVKKYSESGLLGRGAGLLHSLKEGVAPAPDRDQWANVKWYGKVTIGRPGKLQGNDRIIIPFQYLPPPPRKVSTVLEKRVELSQQLRANTPFGQLVESSSTWQSIPIGSAQSELQHKKRGLSALFSRGSTVESNWSLELPSEPAVFPLQASIPFTIVSQAQKQVGAPLSVGLYRRVHLYRRKDSEAVDERLLVAARVAPKPAVLVSQAKGIATYRWQGVVDLPTTAGPSFATDVLAVTYYLGIKELHPSSPKGKAPQTSPMVMGDFVLVVPVDILCPAPRMITPARPNGQEAPPAPSAAQGSTSIPPPPPRRTQPSGILWAGDEKRALAQAEAEKMLPPPPPPPPPSASLDASTSTAGPSSAAAGPPPAFPEAYAAPPQAEEMHVGLDLPPSYFEATRIRDED